MIEKMLNTDCTSCSFCYRDKKYNRYCDKFKVELPSEPDIFCLSYEYRTEQREGEDARIHEHRMASVDRANRLFEKYRPYVTRPDTLYQGDYYVWFSERPAVKALCRLDELEPWDGVLPED